MAWDKEKDILALMTGHGKSTDGSWDPGCVYGNYTEAALMLDIVKVAAKKLRAKGIKVLTDADKNNNRNMVSCARWANNKRARLYISVHCDYKGASKGVYPLFVSAAGAKMGKHIGKRVAKKMGMVYKGRAKRVDLYELNATNMPAIILETGAIKADLKYLKNADKYGTALATAILSYLETI